MSKAIKTELHPWLPSGDWEGFYCYNHNPNQHKMNIDLSFIGGKIAGSGTDDVAPFIFEGNYDLEAYKLQMTKHYHSHAVEYKGDIDENGIWGTWQIFFDFSKYPAFIKDSLQEYYQRDMVGGFHIWPKKAANNSNATEIKSESEKLKELFVEIFNVKSKYVIY